MPAFFNALLSGQAAWFGIPAVVGSAIFLLRMILMIAGGHHGDFHHEVPSHDAADHHDDSSGAFKVLSIQTITAFAMGFGWAGIAALNGFHKSMLLCGIFGALGGVAMVWVLALLLKATYDLQSSGNIPLAAAVGHEGDVYVTVPAKGHGTGQVRLVINDHMRIYNAHSESDAVPTASKIRVLKVNDDDTLTVTPI